MTTKWERLDEVEAGETLEDYDTGTVVDVDGDDITVAWASGTRTTQAGALLRPAGTRPIED